MIWPAIKRIALIELGGNRFLLYSVGVILATILTSGVHLVDVLLDRHTGLRESAELYASVIARKFNLAKLTAAKTEALNAALARAFADGEALGQRTRPRIVLSGETTTHTEAGPPEVGPIMLKSRVSSALLTIPATGTTYAKGVVTTTITLPKFNFERSFTEAIAFDTALADERDACPKLEPPGSTSTTEPIRRTLVGIDAGLVAGTASIGYEVGARIYPRKLALSTKWFEARVGAYARAEIAGANSRVAGGVSLIFGGGKG